MSGTTSCAICGAPNDCEIARGKSTCWCVSASIPPDVLAQVPEDQRNVVCVCRNCAEAKNLREVSASREDS